MPTLREALEKLRTAAVKDVLAASDAAELDRVQVHYLGRKGELTTRLKEIAALPEKERKAAGEMANRIKADVEKEIARKEAGFTLAAAAALADTEWIDVTAPGTPVPEGHLHLSTQAIQEIVGIFRRLGFTRVRYPEVDWDWYAFEALNMPPDHPARDEWETFFVDLPAGDKGKVVLTPHTSNGQIHELERKELPIRMINISKCYRRQSDVSHVPMFYQFEGLVIDKGISITHLKGVLDHFAKAYFGPERRTRLRPFHFRFTEPSFEVDISCGICGGTGLLADGSVCRLCKQGWVELGGAGMVHPNVLKATGVDPEEWGGFAFGWGLERTFMMKAGVRIDDIRVLYRNELGFLRQF